MSEREEVKRYDYGDDGCFMVTDPHGKYVLYRDHAEALTTAERDEARREREILTIDHADALDAYRQMYESERDRAERMERVVEAARAAVADCSCGSMDLESAVRALDAAEGTP